MIPASGTPPPGWVALMLSVLVTPHFSSIHGICNTKYSMWDHEYTRGEVISIQESGWHVAINGRARGRTGVRVRGGLGMGWGWSKDGVSVGVMMGWVWGEDGWGWGEDGVSVGWGWGECGVSVGWGWGECGVNVGWGCGECGWWILLLLLVLLPMTWMLFYASILHCKAILGRGQPELIRFVMNHAPGLRLIARPVDQQSSALPLQHRRPCPSNECWHNIACWQVGSGVEEWVSIGEGGGGGVEGYGLWRGRYWRQLDYHDCGLPWLV